MDDAARPSRTTLRNRLIHIALLAMLALAWLIVSWESLVHPRHGFLEFGRLLAVVLGVAALVYAALSSFLLMVFERRRFGVLAAHGAILGLCGVVALAGLTWEATRPRDLERAEQEQAEQRARESERSFRQSSLRVTDVDVKKARSASALLTLEANTGGPTYKVTGFSLHGSGCGPAIMLELTTPRVVVPGGEATISLAGSWDGPLDCKPMWTAWADIEAPERDTIKYCEHGDTDPEGRPCQSLGFVMLRD